MTSITTQKLFVRAWEAALATPGRQHRDYQFRTVKQFGGVPKTTVRLLRHRLPLYVQAPLMPFEDDEATAVERVQKHRHHALRIAVRTLRANRGRYRVRILQYGPGRRGKRVLWCRGGQR